MESLIPVINQLQDVCNTVKLPLPINLPQIVVIGNQSSGKSSVIESIVRREFLPRGEGIVTRRPLVIRLFKVEESTQHDRDWVKFNHSDQEFTDFDEVREEIERETDRLCGTNKGINSEPITLAVYSRNVVNLTLVDLPGLIKIPSGDQPTDIGIQVKALVNHYISNPNSIILAVTAANTELATSDAIEIAREVDPDGRRTLAVLTKLDLMDLGTDYALRVLTGQLIAVRLGIIGVVNRSQKDITNKKPIDKAIEDEAIYLRSRYPSIAEKNGQPYLSKRLSQILMRHIRDCLPDLQVRINTLLLQCQAQLDSYGKPVNDKSQTIVDIISRFSLSYCGIIKASRHNIKMTELIGGARIHYIFNEPFRKALISINPLDNLNSETIYTVARNLAGERPTIYVPEVFEFLVASQIKRLEKPSLQCVDLVHKEMGQLMKRCGDEIHIELLRFPMLREKIEEVLTKLLNEQLSITSETVTVLINSYSALIDERRLRFKEAELELPLSNGTGGEAGAGDATMRGEIRECDKIARKIQAYFEIVRGEIQMIVPQLIMCQMVNIIKSRLQNALTTELHHSKLFDTLLSESDEIARQRDETRAMLAALRKASEIINTIYY